LIYNFLFNNKSFEADYYFCDQIIIESSLIFNNEIDYSFPSSCDKEPYFLGFKNFSNVFNEGYNYQSRPLFVGSVYILNLIFSKLFFMSGDLSIHLALISYHLIIANICLYIFLKILNIKNIKINEYVIYISFILLSPIFKWGLFVPSHQTNSFLLILLTLLVLKNENHLMENKTFLLFGIYYLMYRPTLVTLAIFIFYQVIRREQYRNLATKSFIFFVPNLVYKTTLYFINGPLRDEQLDYWGEFGWLKNYLVRPVNYLSQNILGKPLIEYRNYSSDWHCTSIPENFICYFGDTLKVVQYLLLPLILVVLWYTLNSKFSTRSINKHIVISFMFFYFFWSLIGWYTPLRFNLYTVGNVILIFMLLMVINEKNLKNKLVLLLFYGTYFIPLKHWNYNNFQNLEHISIASLIIFGFISISLIFKSKFKNSN